MRALRILLFSLLALIGIALILSLIAPKEAQTSRSIVIDAPQEAVFNTVNNLKSWEDWSPWKEMDPEMKVSYGEKWEGKGGSYSWVGDVAGKGELTIVESKAPKSIATEIMFDGQGNANGSWDFEQTAEGTKTTWGFHSKFPIPSNSTLCNKLLSILKPVFLSNTTLRTRFRS
jgi:carbon monoxide dehydrogenase subunit G